MDSKITQKERVYFAVKKLLGDQFKEGMDVRSIFLPIDPNTTRKTGFKRGYNSPIQNRDLFEQIVAEAGVPRSAVFDSLRRDPRLNGGKKRNWSKEHLPWNEIIARKDLLDSKSSLKKNEALLIGSLRDEGYTEAEINYIVFNGPFPYSDAQLNSLKSQLVQSPEPKSTCTPFTAKKKAG